MEGVIEYLEPAFEKWGQKKDSFDFASSDYGSKRYGLGKEGIDEWFVTILAQANTLKEIEAEEETVKAVNYALHYHAYWIQRTIDEANTALSAKENNLEPFLEHLAQVANMLGEYEKALRPEVESVGHVWEVYKSKQPEIDAFLKVVSDLNYLPAEVEKKVNDLDSLVEQIVEAKDKVMSIFNAAHNSSSEVTSYQSDISRIKEDFSSLLSRAGSGKLAKDFLLNQKHHNRDMALWRGRFVCSLWIAGGASLAVLIWHAVELYLGIEGDHLTRIFKRIFFVFPVVWFAWFCAMQFSSSMRLREGYAFKRSVIHFFESYSDQIAKIDSKNSDTDLASVLTSCYLQVLSENPLNMLGKISKEASPTHNFVNKALDICLKKPSG